MNSEKIKIIIKSFHFLINLDEINKHTNISKKILEDKIIVVTNIEEIHVLADHAKELEGKTVQIEGIKIEQQIKKDISKITKNNIDKIHFNNCEINDAFFPLINSLYLVDKILALTNCNLTPFQAIVILDGCLNPYETIELDLSNNHLGENGSEFLQFLCKRVDENIISLNLSGNGFKSEDIKNFLERRISDYDIYFDDIEEIDK